MQYVCQALSILLLPLAIAFAYFHVRYWTQPGNCSPCNPSWFHWSLALGGAFALGCLLIWGYSSALTQWRSPELRQSLHSVAAKSLIAMLLAAFASLLLIGLVALPLVALGSSLAMVWPLLRHARGEHAARSNDG